MGQLRHGKRRDTNEPEIIEALEQTGRFLVMKLTEFDLLVYDRQTGRLVMMEVKTKTGKLTKSQEAMLMAGWPLRIVRTPQEALDAATAEAFTA